MFVVDCPPLPLPFDGSFACWRNDHSKQHTYKFRSIIWSVTVASTIYAVQSGLGVAELLAHHMLDRLQIRWRKGTRVGVQNSLGKHSKWSLCECRCPRGRKSKIRARIYGLVSWISRRETWGAKVVWGGACWFLLHPGATFYWQHQVKNGRDMTTQAQTRAAWRCCGRVL